MKPAAFDYVRPETLEQALAALAEYGDEAAVLAGGLSLVAMMNMRLARPGAVVDINRLTGLDAVARDGEVLRTGALVRQADAMASAEVAAAVPLLRRALPSVGHAQTRSRGTLAGSVAHADPSAETPLCLATLGGEVELVSVRGTRRVAAREFAEGALSTVREPDEMVTALLWPVQAGGTAFAEIAQRHGDFAIVAVAATAERTGAYALGFGGVEDRARVFEGTATLDEVADAVAAHVAGLEPMQDPKAGADYRAHLARHLGTAVLRQALAEAA